MAAKTKVDIFFDEAMHTYLVDGQEVPSVTEILKPLSNRSYSSVNASVLEYARNRGSAVHEALEIYDLGGDLEVVPETAPYIQAYLEWEQIYKPRWIGVEQIVYTDSFGAVDAPYIGTLDRIGYLNDGKLSVVDIKTSNPTKEALVSVCCQTAAYAEAYLDMYDPDEFYIWRYALFLKSDGTFRFQECEEYAGKYGINDRYLFEKLLQSHTLVTQALEAKVRKK